MVVPVPVQASIVAHAPQLAYIPSRVPAGYHYLRWSWNQTAGAVRIWFRNGAGRKIVFTSTWQYTGCDASTQTVRVATKTVRVRPLGGGEEAWRCVDPHDGGVLVELDATTGAHVSARDVARVVATAHHVQ